VTCTASPVTSLCSSILGSGACTDCIAGSCCSQLTNCINDTTCSNSSTGPYWDAYLTCSMNCCTSSCMATTLAGDNLLPGAAPSPRAFPKPREILSPRQ
jgi:hypothetical protein